MIARAIPYMGPYWKSTINDFYRRFPELIINAQETIYRKLGLPSLPDDVIVDFGLIDEPGIPMVSPTGLATESSSRRKVIDLSAPAVANNFYGLTTTQQVVTHELVHITFMYYGGISYKMKPTWIKEGIALWTADQTYDSDFKKVPLEWRNGRWADYLSYLTQFQQELRTRSIDQLVRYLLN